MVGVLPLISDILSYLISLLVAASFRRCRYLIIAFNSHVEEPLLQRKTPSHLRWGFSFACLDVTFMDGRIYFNKMSPFCHPNKRTQPEKPINTAIFLVEHTGFELISVSAPMPKVSLFCGLFRLYMSFCPSEMDKVSPKLSPKMPESMIASA